MSSRESHPPVLGLDLGTSTCLACVWHEGRPFFARPDLAYTGDKRGMLDHPGVLMPSVFCDRDGKVVVGHRALEGLADSRYAHNVVSDVKQRMHDDSESTIRVGNRDYKPSQITGHYVKVLVRAAELELDLRPGTLKQAVVTVPANFSPKAQLATIRACLEFGGLQKVELVDEPVAAAYSLGLHEQERRLRILVVDLGGGTLDLALWDVGRDLGPFGFRELGRNGDTRLGGLSWDREIADWALRELDPRFPPEVEKRLMTDSGDFGHFSLFREAEKAKQSASLQMRRERMFDPAVPLNPRKIRKLELAFRPTYEKGGTEHVAEMSSEDFLQRDDMLSRHCELVCRRLFHDAGRLLGIRDFGWQRIDRVYLAGGGSLLPTVQRRFHELSGKPPLLDESPQQAVAKGAALLGELWRQGAKLPGVIGRTRYGRSLGLLAWTNGDAGKPVFTPMIPGNTELPFTHRKPFPILGKPTLRKLEVTFAEEEYHLDGPRHQELATLLLQDLPPGPADGAREEAVITVTCELNMAPKFRIEFRGGSDEGDLNALPRSPKGPSSDGHGSGTIPPNGTPRPR